MANISVRKTKVMNKFTFYILLGFTNLILWNAYVFTVPEVLCDAYKTYEPYFLQIMPICTIVPIAMMFRGDFQHPSKRIALEIILWILSLGLTAIVWVFAFLNHDIKLPTIYGIYYLVLFFYRRTLTE